MKLLSVGREASRDRARAHGYLAALSKGAFFEECDTGRMAHVTADRSRMDCIIVDPPTGIEDPASEAA